VGIDSVAVTLALNTDSLPVVSVTATWGGHILANIDVAVPDAHDIDLSSAEYRVDRRTGQFDGLAVNLRFGSENDCFANDDGRGAVYIYLDARGAHEASLGTFKNCEPVLQATTWRARPVEGAADATPR
jgi:hypothetical protein